MSKYKSISSKTHTGGMPTSLVTRDTKKIMEPTENLYQSLVVIGQRARQVGAELKSELAEKLSEFAPTSDNLEEVHENREQIEISKFYERLPKPSTIAMEEFLAGKVAFRRKEADTEEAPL